MSFDLQLTDRRALVTGGTKGVGAAVVEVLREAGAKVITTARSVPSAGRRRALHRRRSRNGRGMRRRCDATFAAARWHRHSSSTCWEARARQWRISPPSMTVNGKKN